jgi:hypothetical protein
MPDMRYILEICDSSGEWIVIENIMFYEHAIYYQQRCEYIVGIPARLIHL